MVFNPIIQHLKLNEDSGYSLNYMKFISLPFADDLCSITSDKRKHQKTMNHMLKIMQSIILQLKPVKCKTISIRRGVPCEVQFSLGSDDKRLSKKRPRKNLSAKLLLVVRKPGHVRSHL